MPDSLEALNKGLRLAGDQWLASRRWNLWPEVDAQIDYPEFETPFSEIAARLQLRMDKLNPERVIYLFPDDMPPGAWPKYYDRVADRSKRRGVYSGFARGDAIVIVHAFYKEQKRQTLCWRARVIRPGWPSVKKMPRKGTQPGYSKPHHWCEQFEFHFISDIAQMLAKVGAPDERWSPS